MARFKPKEIPKTPRMIRYKYNNSLPEEPVIPLAKQNEVERKNIGINFFMRS
jgi:hypothetical protein